MANRFPLIVDSSGSPSIKELPDGDSLLLGDSEKLLLGDGTDLQLYHDGSNSYLANSTGALKLATETSGIAITIGHSTSETTIGDNLTVTGNLTLGSGAQITEAELEMLDGITAGTVAASKAVVVDANKDVGSFRNITLAGDILAADFDVDASGDINLDAGGGDWRLKDDGTTICTISNVSGDLQLLLGTQDKDFKFQVNDGGSQLDALVLDASLSGQAVALKSARIGEIALTDGTVAWDAAAAANATLLLEENSTISAPSNAVAGAIISIEVAQHATSGPYTLAWNTVFEFAASTAPTMTATDAKTDIFAFRYNGSVWQEIGRVQNMAQT